MMAMKFVLMYRKERHGLDMKIIKSQVLVSCEHLLMTLLRSAQAHCG
jgi:hypothetical protein